jgi:DNA-binding GntR family transcriptional regulator
MSEPSPLDNVGPVAHGALRHRVVHRLLSAIVAGELPAGTRLVAKQLAGRLGVSATPIREALVELEQIGMVQLLHNRGAVVRPFGRTELCEAFHVRRILECEATRCACGRIEPAHLANLKDEAQRLLQRTPADAEQWVGHAVDHDHRFHGLIVEHCGNRRLSDELRRCRPLFQTLFEAVGRRMPAQRKMMAGHLPVSDALLAGDASDAAEAMAQHINSVCRCLEETLFDRQPPPAP